MVRVAHMILLVRIYMGELGQLTFVVPSHSIAMHYDWRRWNMMFKKLKSSGSKSSCLVGTEDSTVEIWELFLNFPLYYPWFLRDRDDLLPLDFNFQNSYCTPSMTRLWEAALPRNSAQLLSLFFYSVCVSVFRAIGESPSSKISLRLGHHILHWY